MSLHRGECGNGFSLRMKATIKIFRSYPWNESSHSSYHSFPEQLGLSESIRPGICMPVWPPRIVSTRGRNFHGVAESSGNQKNHRSQWNSESERSGSSASGEVNGIKAGWMETAVPISIQISKIIFYFYFYFFIFSLSSFLRFTERPDSEWLSCCATAILICFFPSSAWIFVCISDRLTVNDYLALQTAILTNKVPILFQCNASLCCNH